MLLPVNENICYFLTFRHLLTLSEFSSSKWIKLLKE